MILINIKMQIRPEKMDDWLALADSYARDVNAEDGCLFFQFARSLTDENEFVCIEGFTDAQAGAAHYARSGGGGPFRFGAFTAADAMYAPVVSRFHTYAIDVGAASAAYMQAVMALPGMEDSSTRRSALAVCVAPATSPAAA